MNSLLGISIQELKNLGIVEWGYTEVSQAASFHQFKIWQNQSGNSFLPYLKDHRADLRSDIKNVFPAFESALVFHFSYAEIKKYMLESSFHSVAGYSLGFDGDDYHFVLTKRLDVIEDLLRSTYPNLVFKKSIDVLPVLERDLSYRAGLGWFGKNSMLISRSEGSYFIIASLFLSQKLPIDLPILYTDHCGQCQLCIEACPTKAIDPVTRTLLTDKCLSTLTIEVRGDIDFPEGHQQSRGEIFGCDICQDVCPWNKKMLRTILTISISDKIKKWIQFFNRSKNEILSEIAQWSGKYYEKFFDSTVFKRPGRKGMLKNLKD